jgi:hypothetical protein
MPDENIRVVLMFTVTEVLLTVGVKFHAYPKWAAGNVYQPVDRHLQEPRTISGMG